MKVGAEMAALHRAFLAVPALVGRYLESFKEFPPRAKAASFTGSDAMEKKLGSQA